MTHSDLVFCLSNKMLFKSYAPPPRCVLLYSINLVSSCTLFNSPLKSHCSCLPMWMWVEFVWVECVLVFYWLFRAGMCLPQTDGEFHLRRLHQDESVIAFYFPLRRVRCLRVTILRLSVTVSAANARPHLNHRRHHSKHTRRLAVWG